MATEFYDNDKVKELYPDAVGMVFSPMLIKLGTQEQIEKLDTDEDWYAEEKKDGYLQIFVKTTDNVYMFARTCSKKTGLPTEKSGHVPYLKEAFKCLPPETIILGEIYKKGGTSKNVTEILGCLESKAIKRQDESGKLTYYIYDCLRYNNKDLMSLGSWGRKQKLKEIYKKYNFDQYDFIELAEDYVNNKLEQLNKIFAAGGEGMVFKKKDGIYQPGKRPNTNLKAKQKDNIDCIIIGFEPPKKEYSGKEIETWQYWENEDGTLFSGQGYQLGLKPVTKAYFNNWKNTELKIGLYDKNNNLIDFGVVHSGISDEMKKDMSENPNNYLNKVCEIQCMSIDKNGHSLRHAFFKNMREDKNIEDCICDME